MTNFNDRLQHVAVVKKIAQVDLAKMLGMDKATVNRWWTGKSLPRPKSIMAIAENIGCSYDWLATGRGEPFPERPNQRTEMIQTGANGTQAGRDIHARDTHTHKAEEYMQHSAAARHLLEILDKLPNRDDLLNRFVFEALQELQRQNEEKKEQK